MPFPKPDDPRKCQAHSSRTKLPCKKWAIRGTTVCRTHGGAIKRVRAAADRRVEYNKERVLQEYCHISFVDARDLVDKNGKRIPLHKLPDRVAAAIQSIEWDGDIAKVRFVDKKGALDSMARHLGMFAEKNTGEAGVQARFEV